MRVLCIADHVDPLVYSMSIKERFHQVDFVISAGDLRLKYYDYIVSNLNKPLYFVFGNHHLQKIGLFKKRYADVMRYKTAEENDYYSGSCGATYIGNKVVREKHVLIGGLGGSICYNNGVNQFTETQMYLQILKLLPRLLFNRIFRGRYIDILVTHAPPKGIHDGSDRCHSGFNAFLRFMRIFKPRYLIHGHIPISRLWLPAAIFYFENCTF